MSRFLLIIMFVLLSPIMTAQTKSYSTANKTSTYTQCFKEVVDSLDVFLSYRLSKIFYTLADIKKVSTIEDEKRWNDTIRYPIYRPSFDTSLKIQEKILSEVDKKYIVGLLDKIAKHIFSITVNQEFPTLKGKVTFFNCKISGQGLNLIAPSRENWSLLFPDDVIRSIHKRSLLDVFLWQDSTDEDSFLDDEVEIETPIGYLYQIYRNATYYPPCIPVLRRKEFLTLLNNKEIRKKTLTADDIDVLKIIENYVSAEDFWGEVLCNCTFSSQYSRGLLSSLDLKKISAELLAVVKKADKNKEIDDDFIEEYYGNWIQAQVQMALLSNYTSIEIVKYLVFAIAHECYHSWFTYGLIGKSHEFNADAYATFIYLKVFTDKKVMHDFVNKLNSPSESMGISDLNNQFSEHELNSLLQPFVGRSVAQIFAQVLKTNSFYEKNDAFHPAFSERISAIDAIIGESMDSEEVLVKLKTKLLSIFSNQ